MRNYPAMKWSTRWLVFIVGTLLLSVAYFHFVINKKPLAPPVPVVSSCKKLKMGMRRIGNQDGFQFDFPLSNFTISEGTSDAVPIVHGFELGTKNSASVLEISFGSQSMSGAVDPSRILSDHIEKRTIVDDKGQPIGEDYWGYLRSGERWRRVQLRGSAIAKYDFVNERQAELFDRVISSACLLSAPDS